MNTAGTGKDSGLVHPGIIDEWMWRRIIEKMYDEVDARELEERFLQQINLRENQYNQYLSTLSDHQLIQQLNQRQLNNTPGRKLSRDEILQLIKKHQGRLLYLDFQKIILDFQLQEHEKFLNNFTTLFK